MGERTDLNRDENDRSSDDIRRDIRRTQSDISQTVDDIQYRLSPDRLMHQARDRMRAAPRRASEGLMNKIKANPLPAAIAGLGLWMLFKGDSGRDADMDYEYGSGYGRGYGSELYSGGRYPSAGYDAGRGYTSDHGYGYGGGESTTHGAKERLGGVADSAREKISDVASDIGERAHELGDRAAHAGDAAMRGAASMGQRVRYGTRSAMDNVSDMIASNPMMLGAAGAVVGALLGFSIPETERENELMGGARDSLKERAVDLAHEGAQKAKNVATAAAEAATSTVKSELGDEAEGGTARSTTASSGSATSSGSTSSQGTGGSSGSGNRGGSTSGL
jgi:ElaB/YqjD/DUF883 family membrane-anchored ribosome-binding protein